MKALPETVVQLPMAELRSKSLVQWSPKPLRFGNSRNLCRWKWDKSCLVDRCFLKISISSNQETNFKTHQVHSISSNFQCALESLDLINVRLHYKYLLIRGSKRDKLKWEAEGYGNHRRLCVTEEHRARAMCVPLSSLGMVGTTFLANASF